MAGSKEDMPGRCARFADAEDVAELGREIGSIVGGGRTCGPSSISKRFCLYLGDAEDWASYEARGSRDAIKAALCAARTRE
jgi:hypothetical protein